MEKDDIRRNVRKLPLSPLDRIQEDREVWEGEEDGAKFTVSRHLVPLEHHTPVAFIGLTLSGYKTACEHIADQFTAVFNWPIEVSESVVDGIPVSSLAWIEQNPVFDDGEGTAVPA